MPITDVDGPGYPEPPAVGGEAATLAGGVAGATARHLARKCADLDAAGLRTRIGASSITLGGLLRHLAFMEDINFPMTWPDGTCQRLGTG